MSHFSNSLATVIGSMLGGYYYHHATIEQLFAEARAPGPVPEGSCDRKCVAWLKRTASATDIDGLRVLGAVLEELMDTDMPRSLLTDERHEEAKDRVRRTLAAEGLEYIRGGRVISVHATLPALQLGETLRKRDLGGVNKEFARALDTVGMDPEAAVTAACAILEALCKVYIEDNGLVLPSDQTLLPLWKIVQGDLGLAPKSLEDDDLRQILSGLSSVVHGLGALRTHVGSAHGRGRRKYKVAARHARLVVNASHSLTLFLLETWDARVPAAADTA